MSQQIRTFALSFSVAILSVLTIGSLAQTSSPLAGTWKLNVAKSKYSPANLAPKSGTTKLEITGNQLKAVTDGVDSEGRVTHAEYTCTLDGKPCTYKSTVNGQPSPNQDGAEWKKIDDYTYENIAMLKGQVLTTSRTVVAKDGKSRTNTVTGKNAQGQTVTNTVVYEKQ